MSFSDTFLKARDALIEQALRDKLVDGVYLDDKFLKLGVSGKIEAKLLANGRPTITCAAMLAAAFRDQRSRYHNDGTILEAAGKGGDWVAGFRHEDAKEPPGDGRVILGVGLEIRLL